VGYLASCWWLSGCFLVALWLLYGCLLFAVALVLIRIIFAVVCVVENVAEYAVGFCGIFDQVAVAFLLRSVRFLVAF
jgi:hypothetical protein